MNTRNFIISVFLKNYRFVEPLCFLKNEEYFSHFDPLINKILDEPSTRVILITDDELSIHECPYQYKTDKRVQGWLVYNKDTIFSIFVLRELRLKGLALRMLSKAFPEDSYSIRLYFPTRNIFKACRQSLPKKRVYVTDVKY